MYDVVIIGGGIAGLYSAYRLIQMYPTIKILVLEKSRLGGRISTHKFKNYVFEEGASRFHERQPYIISLIRELGLAKKMTKISSSHTYIPISSKKVFSSNESDYESESESELTTQIQKCISQIIKTSRKEKKQVLKNSTFIEYAKRIVSEKDAQNILDSFGYSAELVLMNAYDSIHLIDKHLNPRNQFYVLKDGLSQIVEILTDKLRSKGVNIHRHRNVTSIEYRNSQFEIQCKNIIQTYIARQCICAVTKDALLKFPIFSPIFPILNLISSPPLCRIYSKYAHDKDTKKVWFHGMQKITTNNHLRMIIPVNEEHGIIMISYTDYKDAVFWKRILDTREIDGVNTEIHRLVKQTLGIDIPEPEYTKMYYWSHGVAYFTPGFDSEVMPQRIQRLYEDIPLYVCGENFSEKENQWIEGSLETSENAVRRISFVSKK